MIVTFVRVMMMMMIMMMVMMMVMKGFCTSSASSEEQLRNTCTHDKPVQGSTSPIRAAEFFVFSAMACFLYWNIPYLWRWHKTAQTHASAFRQKYDYKLSHFARKVESLQSCLYAKKPSPQRDHQTWPLTVAAYESLCLSPEALALTASGLLYLL